MIASRQVTFVLSGDAKNLLSGLKRAEGGFGKLSAAGRSAAAREEEKAEQQAHLEELKLIEVTQFTFPEAESRQFSWIMPDYQP